MTFTNLNPMHDTRTLLRRSAAKAPLMIALLALSTLPPLPAQTAPTIARYAPVKMEAVVSTGSRFNDRTVFESPVPIDVITRAEMEQGGYTEVSQMLQALVPSFNFPRPSLTDGTDHIRPRCAGSPPTKYWCW